MIQTVMLTVTLFGAPDCRDGSCRNPRILIRVPGVRIDVRPTAPPIRLVPAPVPYRRPMVYRRGWFGKWKYKSKVKRRGW